MTEVSRIEQLEQQLAALTKKVNILEKNEVTETMSQAMVTHIAGQIQNLFQNPVMLTGVSSAILNNLQQALVFRAGQSKERHPQIMVLDYYVPTSQRCTLTDAGQLVVEAQVAEATDVGDNWVVDETIQQVPDAVNAIVALLKSYGVEADKPYYLIDDLALQKYREDVTRLIEEQNANRAREIAIASA